MAKQQYQAQVLQLVQFGREDPDEYGVKVAANRRLLSLKVDLDPKVIEEDILASGVKSITGTIQGKESTDISLSGQASTNDILYPFSALLCSPVVTDSDVSGLHDWVFFPRMTETDVFDSFTLEHGITGDVDIITGLRCDSMDLTLTPSKGGIDFKGKMFGKKLRDGEASAFTTSPSVVPLRSLSGKGIGIFVSDTILGLDDKETSRVRTLDNKISFSDRHTQVFTSDEEEESYDDTVEKGFKCTGQIVMAKNSASNAYMNSLRASERKYCRMFVGLGTRFMQLDFPFNFRNPKRQTTEDVHCAVFDLMAVYDEDFGGTFKATVRTDLAEL